MSNGPPKNREKKEDGEGGRGKGGRGGGGGRSMFEHAHIDILNTKYFCKI